MDNIVLAAVRHTSKKDFLALPNVKDLVLDYYNTNIAPTKDEESNQFFVEDINKYFSDERDSVAKFYKEKIETLIDEARKNYIENKNTDFQDAQKKVDSFISRNKHNLQLAKDKQKFKQVEETPAELENKNNLLLNKNNQETKSDNKQINITSEVTGGPVKIGDKVTLATSEKNFNNEKITPEFSLDKENYREDAIDEDLERKKELENDPDKQHKELAIKRTPKIIDDKDVYTITEIFKFFDFEKSKSSSAPQIDWISVTSTDGRTLDAPAYWFDKIKKEVDYKSGDIVWIDNHAIQFKASNPNKAFTKSEEKEMGITEKDKEEEVARKEEEEKKKINPVSPEFNKLLNTLETPLRKDMENINEDIKEIPHDEALSIYEKYKDWKKNKDLGLVKHKDRLEESKENKNFNSLEGKNTVYPKIWEDKEKEKQQQTPVETAPLSFREQNKQTELKRLWKEEMDRNDLNGIDFIPFAEWKENRINVAAINLVLRDLKIAQIDSEILVYAAINEVLRDLKEAALDKLDPDKSTPVINNTTKEIEYAQAIPADPTNPSQSELSAEIVDPKNPTNKKIVPINTSEYEQPQNQA